MKQKVVGFTMAMALLLPVGLISAGPASAAALVSCNPPSGSLSFTPGVSSVLKVQTIKISLPLKGCVGGGVKSGTFAGSLKTDPVSVKTLGKVAANLKLVSTITWNTKKKSTFTATTKTTIGKVILSTVTGKITAGLFKGKTFKSQQTVAFGPVVGGVIKTFKITGKGKTTIG